MFQPPTPSTRTTATCATTCPRSTSSSSDPFFTGRVRRQLHSALDFVSSVGGLMSLCGGFSALTVVELGYFFTLRLFYQIKASDFPNLSEIKYFLST